MSRNPKNAIGIIIGVLLIGTCVLSGAWAAIQIASKALGQNVIEEDPELAREVALSIVDYDLPPGYREKAVVDILVGQMVIMEAEQTGSLYQPVIMLLQMDQEIDNQQIRDQFQRTRGQESHRVSLVEERTLRLRGQETALFIYEGVDYKSEPVRQYISGTFASKEGQAVLFIAGPIATWDQEAIEGFMESIR